MTTAPLVVVEPIDALPELVAHGLNLPAGSPGFRWSCHYIDGHRGQHSAWHYDKDDTGWAATEAACYALARAHVVVHEVAGRTPALLERILLARSERRHRARCAAEGWPVPTPWWSRP